MRYVAVVDLGFEMQLRRREAGFSQRFEIQIHSRVIIRYSDLDLELASFVRASGRAGDHRFPLEDVGLVRRQRDRAEVLLG